MRSQMLAKSPKAARADLLFAGVLHDSALEIVLTEVPGDLGAWVSTKCFNPAKFVDVGWSAQDGRAAVAPGRRLLRRRATHIELQLS